MLANLQNLMQHKVSDNIRGKQTTPCNKKNDIGGVRLDANMTFQSFLRQRTSTLRNNTRNDKNLITNAPSYGSNRTIFHNNLTTENT